MAIALVTTDEGLRRCFPVMQELRPHLADEASFLQRVRAALDEGAEMAALEQEGAVATVALFRVRTMLVSGLTMYVDDLVTAERARSQGHGAAMLGWLQAYARTRGCQTFSLDSGTFRRDAHAFYFREGMRITSFHFESKL